MRESFKAEPIEAVLKDVVEKYRSHLDELNALLDSDPGFPVTPYRQLSPVDHQSILYGRLFRGLDKPLGCVDVF